MSSGINHTGWACPICDQNKITSHLMTRVGGIGAYCGNGHTFNDMEQLKNSHPRTLPVPKPIPKPQEGHEEIRVSVPSKVRQDLQAKFGNTLPENVGAVLRAVVDPRTIIVSGLDVQQIESWTKLTILDAGTLKGAIYSLTMDLKQAKENLASLEATRNGKGITVNLDGLEEAIQQRADMWGITNSEVVKQITDMGIKNGWV